MERARHSDTVGHVWAGPAGAVDDGAPLPTNQEANTTGEAHQRPEATSEEVGLLAAAAEGQHAAARALLDRVGPAVYGFIFARVGGDAATAEDLVQETFIEAMRSSHTFRGESPLRTWMCTIARRRIARHWERERKAEVARAGLRPLGEAAPAEDVEERDAIVRALGALPPIHRQVLVMKYLDDLSVADIAARLGRSRIQVQSLLQRARDGLRREMGSPDA